MQKKKLKPLIYSLTITVLWSIFPIKLFGMELDPDKIRVNPPETNIAVVQNRYFNKVFRPELGLFYGRIMDEAYTETTYLGYRLSMFFTEGLGIEISSSNSFIEDSPDKKALDQLKYPDPEALDEYPSKQVQPTPEINRVMGAFDVSLFFTPLYGKVNVLDSFIIYSDLSLTAGYSLLQTEQGNLNAFTYGVGQKLYFTKSLSFRWDLRMKRYEETRLEEPVAKNAYYMDFGLCYFLF